MNVLKRLVVVLLVAGAIGPYAYPQVAMQGKNQLLRLKVELLALLGNGNYREFQWNAHQYGNGLRVLNPAAPHSRDEYRLVWIEDLGRVKDMQEDVPAAYAWIWVNGVQVDFVRDEFTGRLEVLVPTDLLGLLHNEVRVEGYAVDDRLVLAWEHDDLPMFF